MQKHFTNKEDESQKFKVIKVLLFLESHLIVFFHEIFIAFFDMGCKFSVGIVFLMTWNELRSIMFTIIYSSSEYLSGAGKEIHEIQGEERPY